MKKNYIKMIVATGIISTIFIGQPVKADIGTGIDVVSIVSNLLEKLAMEPWEKHNKITAANDGLDIENHTYISPAFSKNKFFITSYWYDASKEDTLYRVKIYSEKDANNPKEVSLKKGQQLGLDMEFDDGECIFEFFKGNEEAPFERFYLSNDMKNKIRFQDKSKFYGIALGTNKNVFYLEKELGRVLISQGISWYFGPTQGSKIITDSEVENAFKKIPENEKHLFVKKARKVNKVDMSKPNYSDNNKILEKLTEWKSSGFVYRDYIQSVADSITLSNIRDYKPAPIDFNLNSYNTLENHRLWKNGEENGLNDQGAIKFKVPIFKTGFYKVKLDSTGDLVLKDPNKNKVIQNISVNEEKYIFLNQGANMLGLSQVKVGKNFIYFISIILQCDFIISLPIFYP